MTSWHDFPAEIKFLIAKHYVLDMINFTSKHRMTKSFVRDTLRVWINAIGTSDHLDVAFRDQCYNAKHALLNFMNAVPELRIETVKIMLRLYRQMRITTNVDVLEIVPAYRSIWRWTPTFEAWQLSENDRLYLLDQMIKAVGITGERFVDWAMHGVEVSEEEIAYALSEHCELWA